MHALTVRQPWAEAIARFGKLCENRSRRPPAHLLGQRIAIHVSQSKADPGALLDRETLRYPQHLRPMADFMLRLHSGVPDAGRIIATARLVGWVDDRKDERAELEWDRSPEARFDREHTMKSAAWDSPWRIDGQCGWILSDVRALREPVGADPCVVCQARREDPSGSYGHASNCAGAGRTAIRGRLGFWPLSPEVQAAVLAQEAK